MAYQPKIVKGMVSGTGYPIDGHVLYFSLWDYDNYDTYHLYGWDDADDEAVMLTMYEAETSEGLSSCPLSTFKKRWKAKQWEPDGAFCLVPDTVEVLEVLQEEVKDDARERLRAHGIDLSPRYKSDRGGILCLPLDKNLNGDVKARHPDWERMECPGCSRACWKPGGVDELVEKQGVQLLCTECALSAGLVKPAGPSFPTIEKPAMNREQRRRAKHGK